MDKSNLTFEECLTLAKEHLETKERDKYYEFLIFNDNFAQEVVILNQLSNEEANQLRTLKSKYGEKEYINHLDEVFDDPEYIHDLTAGCELIGIDLDNKHHKYGITLHELHPDGTIRDIKYAVELDDEQYAKLVACHIFDVHLTINTMRHYDHQLYDSVMTEADYYYTDLDGDCLFVNNPYLVTLDEAKADAELIVKKHGIKRSTGYRLII